MGADMHIRKVLYFHRKRQKNSQIYFSAAVQKAAALFVSTYFYFFSQQSAKYSIKRAPVTKRVRALFLSTKQTNFLATTVAGDSPGCRSPPSDFDFAYQLKKSELEELPMKEINLRDYYPFYTKDTVVEVPDEVADLLREYKLSDAAHFLRTYRHKAYFSLDYDKNVERDALVVVLAPEDILIQEEEHGRLYQAITLLPEKQRNRICSHYLRGMSLSEIAKSEHSAVSSVHEGIQRGLRRLKKILEEI